MTESVNSTVITGRRIKGPESPEPLTWIRLAPALSFGDAPTLAGRVPCCPSRAVWGELSSCFPAPSCCSSPAILGTGFSTLGPSPQPGHRSEDPEDCMVEDRPLFLAPVQAVL